MIYAAEFSTSLIDLERGREETRRKREEKGNREGGEKVNTGQDGCGGHFLKTICVTEPSWKWAVNLILHVRALLLTQRVSHPSVCLREADRPLRVWRRVNSLRVWNRSTPEQPSDGSIRGVGGEGRSEDFIRGASIPAQGRTRVPVRGQRVPGRG